MKKTFTILATLGILFGLTITALADHPKPLKNKVPVARKRQHEQQQRVGQGVRSGELTAKETIRLEKEQRGINHDIRDAKSDGVVTGAERKDIHQDQNQASRHIYRAKHNRRDRN
jgi:cytochrome c-type biogenesis protein CcmE